MCMGACCFAGLAAIYFGAHIADKGAFGLRDPGVGAPLLGQLVHDPPKIVGGYMRDQCLELFRDYCSRTPVGRGRSLAGQKSAPTPKVRDVRRSLNRNRLAQESLG